MLYLYTGATAFILAAFLMPLAIRILQRTGAVDAPSKDKIHSTPTPRGGGIVIFLAFAIAVILPNYRDNPMKGVLLGSAICLFVGALDDLRGGVPAVFKLGALTLATLVMSFFGVQLNLFGYYPLDLFFTWLWIVGVTSAFNGIDNMDGLAAGVAVIVSGMYLLIALDSYYLVYTQTSLSWFGLLASGLIGANLGFLLYNLKPGKVFMGDAGSFFLGFILAALGVMGEWADSRVVACTIPLLILGVPIFDFAYIIIARITKGETRTLRSIIEHCAPDHLSHRLVWFGFTQRKAVLIIYLMSVVLGLSGILLRNSERGIDSLIALIQGAAVLLLIAILMATAERRHAKNAPVPLEEYRHDTAPPPAEEEDIRKTA